MTRSSTGRASSRSSTAPAITMPARCCATGRSRSTSSRPASPSSDTRAAAAPIRPSTPCSISCTAHGLTPDNVAHVVSWTHPRRLAHTNRPDPAQRPRCQVQRAILPRPRAGRRQVVLSQFDDDAYLDPLVAKVMARIEAAPHPQMSLAEQRAFRRRGDGDHHRRAAPGEGSGHRGRTHLGRTRCPVRCWRRSIAIAPAAR